MKGTIMSRELFVRHKGNPLFTWENWPYAANTVFNPAATLGKDGETIVLARVEDLRGVSHLTVARSEDGKTNWKIDEKPSYLSNPHTYPEEEWGIEDPRITYLEDRDEYAILYTAYSPKGPLVSMAMTKDFNSFERWGPITCPENKDAALFPRRIGGRYAMLHRPVTNNFGANIWISFSPDLRHWGDHQEVLTGRAGPYWDAKKIGLNTPPIETEDGWLICYHGVRTHCSGALYRLGLALLERDNPSRLVGRTDQWVFGPRESYEMTGDVSGVVFPCGWTFDEASGEIRLYYGGADSCIGLATAKLDDILALLRANPLRC